VGHLLDLLEPRCGFFFFAVGVKVLLLGEVPSLLQVLDLVLEVDAEAYRPVNSA
jgi:hypothetical protein